jgi:hypothetical protein
VSISSDDVTTAEGEHAVPASSGDAQAAPAPAMHSAAAEAPVAAPAADSTVPCPPGVDDGDGLAEDPAGPADALAAANGQPTAVTQATEMPGLAAQDLAADEPAAVPAVAPAGEDAGGYLRESLAQVAASIARIDDLAEAVSELARLRSRDADLIVRLHDDVTRLRTGEIATALNPLVTGMIKLYDQMVSLGALNDLASPVGMLHTQLLQILELTCAVKPFGPSAGQQYDASRHTGTKRIPTADPAVDGTIAATMRVGFIRADGSIVRVAEVEVHRLSG